MSDVVERLLGLAAADPSALRPRERALFEPDEETLEAHSRLEPREPFDAPLSPVPGPPGPPPASTDGSPGLDPADDPAGALRAQPAGSSRSRSLTAPAAQRSPALDRTDEDDLPAVRRPARSPAPTVAAEELKPSGQPRPGLSPAPGPVVGPTPDPAPRPARDPVPASPRARTGLITPEVQAPSREARRTTPAARRSAPPVLRPAAAPARGQAAVDDRPDQQPGFRPRRSPAVKADASSDGTTLAEASLELATETGRGPAGSSIETPAPTALTTSRDRKRFARGDPTSDPARPDPTARPAPTPRPDPTARPDPTNRPDQTARPARTGPAAARLRATAPEPSVLVSIGRIDVRASAPSGRRAESGPGPYRGPRVSLDDYLRARQEGGR